MNAEQVLLDTYRKWTDETLIATISTFTRPGSVASRPFTQVLKERGLDSQIRVSPDKTQES